MPYQHTQRGTTLLWGLGISSLVVVLMLVVVPAATQSVAAWAISAVVVIVLLASAIIFSSLTIRVDDDTLRWQFGPGAISKSVPISDITSAEPTTTTVLEGWGIHLTTRGWLYNVSGRQAVLVTRRRGGRFLLGTDEPDALASAIRSRLRPR